MVGRRSDCTFPAALSMQVRALEAELGTAPFERTSRRVLLTEAGVLFRVEAERTVRQAARAKDVAQRAACGEVGTVRIGFVGNAAFAGKPHDASNRI